MKNKTLAKILKAWAVTILIVSPILFITALFLLGELLNAVTSIAMLFALLASVVSACAFIALSRILRIVDYLGTVIASDHGDLDDEEELYDDDYEALEK
ncbi:hypothetical protein [Anaerotruncus massiliensis (ex Togo et al. 2019)]|uniref:hypothetical protein n=1 Tax=Anaerotruncus TaxID=244127 RepID=UPI0027B9D73A|nr:hypothetical protein [Anaerotruncus massiliensis (ex Togo et al. 2019)]